MVVFDCNGCGDALKKSQVLKHRMQCRNSQKLSCIDCGQDFYGSEYEKHIKCITEEEKYSGKNYKPKVNANKGVQKQEIWTEQVQAAIEKVNLNSNLKEVLKTLQNYPNIPRKKAKFINFMVNSMRINQFLASEAWDAISSEINLNKESCNKEISEIKSENCSLSKETGSEIISVKKSKKRKNENGSKTNVEKINDEELTNGTEKLRKKQNSDISCANSLVKDQDSLKSNKFLANGSKFKNGINSDIDESSYKPVNCENKFNIKVVIKNCLQKVPNQQMQIKKLGTLVYKEYILNYNDEQQNRLTKKQFFKKLTKKLTKINKIMLKDDLVALINK